MTMKIKLRIALSEELVTTVVEGKDFVSFWPCLSLHGTHVFGSGLAVEPNPDEQQGQPRDAIFGLASQAGAEDQEQVRRTITMVRSTGLCTIDCFLIIFSIVAASPSTMAHTVA